MEMDNLTIVKPVKAWKCIDTKGYHYIEFEMPSGARYAQRTEDERYFMDNKYDDLMPVPLVGALHDYVKQIFESWGI